MACTKNCPGVWDENTHDYIVCKCPQGKPCECFCPYSEYGTVKPEPAGPTDEDYEAACKRDHGSNSYYDSSSETCKCKAGYVVSGNTCVAKAEKCTTTCESGEKQEPYPDCSCTVSDKCKDVECDPFCKDNTLSYNGTCNPADGKCVYQTKACQFGCAADGKSCKGGVKGKVYYSDIDPASVGRIVSTSVQVPLRHIKVVFFFTDSKGTLTYDPNKYFTWSDNAGAFEYYNPEVFAPGNTVGVGISFEDENNKLYLTEEDYVDKPTALKYRAELPYDDPSFSNLVLDLAQEEQLRNFAKIYADVLRAVEFKESVIGKGDTVMERVVVNSADKTAHSEEEFGPSPNGMIINKADSGFFTSEAPANREFHEYCHHILAEARSAGSNPPGESHAGYTNPSSEWGLQEGWAVFCALEMKKHYGVGKAASYEVQSSKYNLELNFAMDGEPNIDEEFAIAGILLDLRDSSSYYGGSADDDNVSVPLSTIWNAMSTPRDFGDGSGSRLSKTVRDLYLALKADAADDSPLNSPIDDGTTETQLERIFEIHNAYQDTSKNGQWDEGEEFGYSGKGSSLRYDVKLDPGSFVKVEAKDQNGRLITEGIIARVSVEFDSPNERYSYTYDTPVVDGQVGIPAPPENYPATITITALQGGTNNAASAPFTVTTQEFYGSYDASKPLSAYSPVIHTSQPSCQNDVQCGYWGIGNTCQAGACKTVERNSGYLGDEGKGGCSSAFIIALLVPLALLWRSSPSREP
ncbi:MAG: hypothetical protein V1861_05815 [Candidatus Micrarchaeota archaeon]